MKNGGMDPILASLSKRWQDRTEGFAASEATREFVAPSDDPKRTEALVDRLKERRARS